MKKATTAHLKRLQLVKPYLGRLLLGFLAMLVAAGLQLAFPKALSYFMDNISENNTTDWYTLPAILAFVGFVLYCIASAV
ncbi:MAG TPA: ABC transporter permease, partial [Cytophagales bacterium]|nr:ABC transporter permease [Cytophagales bacterium]